MSNIVTALYNDTGRARTRPLYRYDYGQVLQINGTTLPETYEVHFSNSVRDEAVTVTGNANGVEIPDTCLMDGRPVYAWLYMHTGEDDGETVFHITIPVIDRSCPSGEAPTPIVHNLVQEALEGMEAATTAMNAHFPATGKFVAGTGSVTANYAAAEGNGTTASGVAAHAEGNMTEATGESAHAEGSETVASGGGAHAEGQKTEATGYYSHAEGVETAAHALAAHAEGIESWAIGWYSHAQGQGTTARNRSQHVMGEFNEDDPSNASSNERGRYAEIVGNGTSMENQSNARTLDWSGNEELAGDLTVNKGSANEVSVTEIVGDVSTLKSATFYKIIVGANAIVPTIRNSTLTYGISGPNVTATYRLVDGANKLIDTIETTTLNSSTAGQSATQRLLYVVWNVTTHKMEIVASLAYNAENIYIIGYYNEATADGAVYQSPFPYYNTDFPADNKTLQDDVQDLKSASLTAQQKQMLVGLFSSTANTGHASGDPVLAGTYVLKCDVATATGSGSMFTFKWVKES